MDTLLPNVRTLLETVCNSGSAKREDYLRAGCKIAGANSSAAILWLFDQGRNQDLYSLDRVVAFPNEDVPTTKLERILCHRDSGDKGEGVVHDGREIDPKRHPQLQQWCLEKSLIANPIVFPLGDPKSRTRFVGFLQIMANEESNDSLRNELLTYLAESFADFVSMQREARCLHNIRELGKRARDIKSRRGLFQMASDILCQFTMAEMCLIYCQESDLSFVANAGTVVQKADSTLKTIPDEKLNQLVVTPGSRVQQIADKRLEDVKIHDFLSEKERIAVFGTRKYDTKHVAQIEPLIGGPLQTLAASPVIIEERTIAVAMLFNKRDHLARVFSSTDSNILRTVCDVLTLLVPSVESHSALDELAALNLSGSLDQTVVSQIFSWLQDHIPGVASAGLYRIPAFSHQATFEPIGGANWFATIPLSNIYRSGVHELPRTSSGKRFRYLCEIPRLSRGTAVLALGLNRDYLATHEKGLVTHLCAELSHIIRAEQTIQEATDQLIQTRHVINATLNGLANIQPACQIYRRVAGPGGDAAELHSARFHKLLERTELFYLRTWLLMEESRFLLEDISRDSLRVDRHSITNLLKEACQALRREADRRGITINLSNKVPYGFNEVDIDRDLILIGLLNILDNAIKYSFRNQDVTVEAEFSLSDWVVRITDYGTWIPPEDRDRVFERFQRRPTGQHAAKRLGTGLGLTVALSIVTAHGGSIELTSTPTRTHPEILAETTFTIRVPKRLSKG